MKKTALPISSSENTISVQELARHIQTWLITCEISQHSLKTIEARTLAMQQFQWFLNYRGFEECGLPELREFFRYLNTGHTEPGGRWGNPRLKKPLRPVTIATFHKHLRTFYNWMVREEILTRSPIDKIPAITVREDQVQPFTMEQVKAILEVAKKSNYPKRDKALVYFLVDTGLRASEVCSLKLQDIDFKNYQCTFLGKGNKYRTVSFSKTATKALWDYCREEKQESHDPLFLAARGANSGAPLTRSGLFQLIQRLARKAGINSRHIGPHTLRHTFSTEFLRNGGEGFTLKQMLGHTTLKMTNRYVAVAQADIQKQHRKFSPADRL